MVKYLTNLTLTKYDMTIEIVENEENTQLCINGTPVLSNINIQSTDFMLSTSDTSAIEQLLLHEAKELPLQIHLMASYVYSENLKIDFFSIKKVGRETTIEVTLNEDVGEWDFPYTINEFIKEFRKNAPSITIDIEDQYLYLQAAKKLSPSENLQNGYLELAHRLSRQHLLCHNQLKERSLNDYLLRTFTFPGEYQAICSQYLIWFGEFLENFGINALISVNHKGQDTQVTISSQHTEKMFQEIESLFSQYISLPYAEFLPANSQQLIPEQQFLVTQLQTQINHFKGQLEMKSSALQLKEATIQSLQGQILSQQNTIDVQKNQLLLIESIQDEKDLELFGGVVSIGNIEWGPIKISPKKLFRLD